MTTDEVTRLLAALRREWPNGDVQLVETHISWVLLAGEEALKIKKPVDLGFLDFSTLARRLHFCEEELRLNGRLAPDLYLDVVAIGGTPDEPLLDGTMEAFEYAVRMRRFSQDDLLSNVLARGDLTFGHVERLANELAAFHTRIPRSDADSPFGTAEAVWRPVEENFDPLLRDAPDAAHRDRLGALRDWSVEEFQRRRDDFSERKRDGFVRECHGDAHLANVILVRDAGHDGVRLFDGIEFSPGLRWIDVVCDAAFTTMDLADRGRTDFANRFLDAYLERTGDHRGLVVLPFYLVYRSLVRAKVSAIRLSQPDVAEDERGRVAEEWEGYLTLAERYARTREPRLIITCGVSGSGKSTVTRRLVDRIGAVRVRSDVVRKRLAGCERSSAGSTDDLYSLESTDRTYARLRESAEQIVRAGFTAIVDATFLERSRRDSFRRLAADLGVPFLIAHVFARPDTLRERVARRSSAGTDVSDADLEVLERQLARREPLGRDEIPDVVDVDTEESGGVDRLTEALSTR